MSQSEKLIDNKYVNLGYKVLNKGHVDRVYFKLDDKKNIIPESIIFVEIKYNGGRLEYEQAVMRKILESLNLNYKLENVTKNKL